MGEGPHDKAFVNHIKGLFDTRETEQTIKVQSADGGSPKDIIKSAIRSRHAAYDRRYVFMDTDVPITPSDKKYAREHKIGLILSEPLCLECMLLEVLGKRSAHNCQDCKERLHPMLFGSPTRKESYAELFPSEVLMASDKKQIQNLIRIISND